MTEKTRKEILAMNNQVGIRVHKESNELTDKIAKLRDFLDTPERHEHVSEPQLELLRRQRSVMIDYNCILDERIESLTDDMADLVMKEGHKHLATFEAGRNDA